MDIHQRNKLIIGCGYLGKTLARQLKDSKVEVFGTTRNADKLSSIEQSGIQGCLFDIERQETWEDLQPGANVGLDLYVLVPPSQIKLELFKTFLEKVNDWDLRRAILASSTVVYGNREREVDADSEVEIDSIRAERQYAIEQVWTGFGNHMKIVRFAGLYGSERVIGKQLLLNEEVVPGCADGWLNLIHIKDAASLLLAVTENDEAHAIELGSDGRPVLREQYYSDLAVHLGARSPLFSGTKDETGRGRRCSNAVTINRTGWVPQFTDYKDCF